MTYTAIIEQGNNGWYVAQCAEILRFFASSCLRAFAFIINNMINSKFLILLFLSLAFVTRGEDNRNNAIGLHYAFGKVNYSRATDYYNIGGNNTKSDNYRGENYLGLALDYSHKIGEKTDFCTGFVATWNFYQYRNSGYLWTSVNQGGGGQSYENDYRDGLGLFSLPLHLKYHLWRLSFGEITLGGGFDLNYHPSKSYTWGVGLNANTAWEYTFKSGMYLALSPMLQWNILNLLQQKDLGASIDKLTQLGLNINTGFKW